MEIPLSTTFLLIIPQKDTELVPNVRVVFRELETVIYTIPRHRITACKNCCMVGCEEKRLSQ